MKIIQSIHYHVKQRLIQSSKIDGRIWVTVALLGYFCFLWVANFFAPYYSVWRKLGVPSIPSFIDLRAVLKGFECTRLGYDVLLENSCGPQVVYPRLWWRLSGLGLNSDHTVILAIILAIVFYIITFAIIGRLNLYEGVIYSLILCSPPVMLLIERGNVDIIIYALLFLTLILAQSQRLWVRILGYFSLLIPTFLKILSFFALTVTLKETRKIFIFCFFPLVILSIIYISKIRGELAVAQDYFAVKTWYSFGYKILLYKLPSIFSYSYIFARNLHLLTFPSLIIGLIGLCLFIFRKIIPTVVQEFRKTKDDLLVTSISINSKILDAFRIGGSLYIGTFIVTISFDYKLSFLIFAIPQIILWIKQDNPQLSVPSSFALIGIVLTFYLSPFFHDSLVDELVNWFLWFYFLYAFVLTLPQWIKLSIHRLIPAKILP